MAEQGVEGRTEVRNWQRLTLSRSLVLDFKTRHRPAAFFAVSTKAAIASTTNGKEAQDRRT
jgi:hypothetical protein